MKHQKTTKQLKQTNTIHGNMFYIMDDPTIGRSLELYGEYCQPEIELLKGIVQPDYWVYDIGANIGTHTIGLAPYVKKVIAFEPDMDLYDVLVTNLSITAKENVVPVRLALGDHQSTISTQFDYGKTKVIHGSDGHITAFDMIEGFPGVDLVKIDVEGQELTVLRGMRNTLLTDKPILFIEMQDPNTYKETFDYLKQFNYDMWWAACATFNPNNNKKNAEDVFGPQHGVVNWLCSAHQLNTTLQPVVDRDDTMERMIWRQQNVAVDSK